MSDNELEIDQLKARIAELEARPQPSDLEWLRNSNSFKRAERATSPEILKLNRQIVLGGIFGFFAMAILSVFISSFQ